MSFSPQNANSGGPGLYWFIIKHRSLKSGWPSSQPHCQCCRSLQEWLVAIGYNVGDHLKWKGSSKTLFQGASKGCMSDLYLGLIAICFSGFVLDNFYCDDALRIIIIIMSSSNASRPASRGHQVCVLGSAVVLGTVARRKGNPPVWDLTCLWLWFSDGCSLSGQTRSEKSHGMYTWEQKWKLHSQVHPDNLSRDIQESRSFGAWRKTHISDPQGWALSKSWVPGMPLAAFGG